MTRPFIEIDSHAGLMHPVAQAEAENIRAEILAIAAELEAQPCPKKQNP